MARYEDLLNELPRGSEYANSGYVLPFRDEDQEFLFSDSNFPNQVYGVFVDDRFFGTVTSNANGDVIVRVPLELGPHEIAIENDFNARRIRSQVTVRDYAVWYAAYADVFEGTTSFFGIDPGIDSIERSTKLATADVIHIEDVYGRNLRQPNDVGYITDSYRTVLQSLRQAHRYYAVRPQGVAQAVAAHTSSLAWVRPRALRPTWLLGTQFAPTKDFDQASHAVTTTFPNLNAVSQTAVASFASSVLTPTFTQLPSAQRVVVTFTTTWGGGDITIAGTDTAGTVVSEVFTPSGTAIGGFVTKQGSEVFAAITSITNNVAGTAGTARVGLTAEAFITVIDVEGQPVREGRSNAGTIYLTYNNNAGVESLSFGPTLAGNNDNRVDIPVSGRYTIPFRAVGERFAGVIPAPGGFDFDDGSGTERGEDRLYLNIGNRGTVVCVLGQAGLTGQATSTVTTDINDAFAASAQYPAGAPASTLTSTTGVTGDVVAIDSSVFPFLGDTTRSQVRVELGCADAARDVFGIPRFFASSTGAASASATSISYSTSGTLNQVAAPFKARIGRGIALTGTCTLTNAGGRLATVTSPTVNIRVGECIRILSGGTVANQGLHRVVAVSSPTSFTIQHESLTGTFTTIGGQPFQAWFLGDVVDVTAHDTGTGTLTIDAPGLPRDVPSSAQIELADEMPFQTEADNREAASSLVVDVDLSQSPGVGTVQDDLALSGQLIPDGWVVTNGTAFVARHNGLTSEVSFGIQRGAAGDIQLQANINSVVPLLRGFPIRISFWVEQHQSATEDFRIDVAWNGGATPTFDTGTTVAVEGTFEDDTSARVIQGRSTLVQRVVTPPQSAVDFDVRLVHVGGATGDRISVERCIITSDFSSGLFVGQGTVVRSDRRRFFGEMIYVWSPSPLTADERDAIGVAAPPAVLPASNDNIIDRITNAHGLIERYDVSEHNVSGTALNVLGAHDDAGWLAATLTNMDVRVGVPGRLSYVRPTRTSRIEGEELTLVSTTATTSALTTHTGPFPQAPNGTLTLFEDGIPVPDTADGSATLPYEFTSATSLVIDAGVFNGTATYTADYDVLIQAETAVIDLGANFANYLWLVDVVLFRAIDQTVEARTTEESVTFLADGSATLSQSSDQDKNNAILIADDGVSRTTVPEAEWTFVDQSTIQINLAAFDASSIYSLQYQAMFAQYAQTPDFTVELRSAATSAAVGSASYAASEIDGVVDNSLRYHQLRLTLTSVANVDDIQVRGLGVRGLNLFGSTPNAPGIALP